MASPFHRCRRHLLAKPAWRPLVETNWRPDPIDLARAVAPGSLGRRYATVAEQSDARKPDRPQPNHLTCLQSPSPARNPRHRHVAHRLARWAPGELGAAGLQPGQGALPLQVLLILVRLSAACRTTEPLEPLLRALARGLNSARRPCPDRLQARRGLGAANEFLGREWSCQSRSLTAV